MPLAFESEYLKLRNLTVNIPKYLTLLTQDNVWPSRVDLKYCINNYKESFSAIVKFGQMVQINVKQERCQNWSLSYTKADTKHCDHAPFHLTQAKQPESQFSKTASSSTDSSPSPLSRYTTEWESERWFCDVARRTWACVSPDVVGKRRKATVRCCSERRRYATFSQLLCKYFCVWHTTG